MSIRHQAITATRRTDAMRTIGSAVLILAVVVTGAMLSCGCTHRKSYGVEQPLTLPGKTAQVWAVAPAQNLSGYKSVDPLLQADLLYQQLQQVRGITAIPVNRVVDVYTALHLDKVQSEDQASVVCEQLGCDALLVPTVTAYDPYDPPKFGLSLQLFARNGRSGQGTNIDPRELVRRATPPPEQPLPATGAFVQAVGMFDAANGSVRAELEDYARGRTDPNGPLGAREYLVSMDRYCAFAYTALIEDLLNSPQLSRR